MAAETAVLSSNVQEGGDGAGCAVAGRPANFEAGQAEARQLCLCLAGRHMSSSTVPAALQPGSRNLMEATRTSLTVHSAALFLHLGL